MLWNDEEAIGQIREEAQEDGMRISYSVAKEKRSLGYGKLLLQVYEYMKSAMAKKPSFIYAEVKHDNVASQKLFEELGYFHEIKEKCHTYKKSNLSPQVLDHIKISTGGGVFTSE